MVNLRLAVTTPFSVRMETDDIEKLIEFIQEKGKSSKEFNPSGEVKHFDQEM
ncbi:hypothetical protein KPL35_14560 [Clostridium sp. CF011]|uniref:hypothetical protein n=1 Tax=Clostridium sp. CF011 TaxID=2843318 RepID=UPI001C0E2907|nr:hypothetical protein [Clostridium sp. CF011]MBU3093291.1 hypothetical protein [Clostridium sp. CF011]WAG70631.1 hypothetical protein LL036_04105 [Clostridium sp. CF011]